MARKKNFDFTKDNPYEFFTRGRSRKAIEMDYSMSAKPPSRKEHRVNRTDYPGEDEAYLAYFKKHNIPIPKKSGSSGTKKKTTKSSGTTTKKTTKKSSAAKTTTKKKTTKKSSAAKTTTKKKTTKKKMI